MSLSSQKILNISITTVSRKVVLEEIKKYLSSGRAGNGKQTQKHVRPLVVVTPNPEQIVFARAHPFFRDLLNRADVALPDGIGIIGASRFLLSRKHEAAQKPITERIPGVEFVENLVAIASKRGIRIGLIGGFDGLAVRALECLQARYPGLNGWAETGPELARDTPAQIDALGNAYWSGLVQKIRESHVQILFVGLGAPKQEYVIDRLVRESKTAKLSDPLVMMAVGGTFNILAGTLKRAPQVIRSMGFEWFWRLLQEPWRWKRQIALIQFVWLVLYEKCISFFRKPGITG